MDPQDTRTIKYIKKKDINLQGWLVYPEADVAITQASDEDILMLQMTKNSPKVVVKAYLKSIENMRKIARVDDIEQLSEDRLIRY